MTKEKFREIIKTILDNPGSRVTIVITEGNDDEGASMHDIINESYGYGIKVQRRPEGVHATRLDMSFYVSTSAAKNPAFDLFEFIKAKITVGLSSYCKRRSIGTPLRVATDGFIMITYDDDTPETLNFRAKFGILNQMPKKE